MTTTHEAVAAAYDKLAAEAEANVEATPVETTEEAPAEAAGAVDSGDGASDGGDGDGSGAAVGSGSDVGRNRDARVRGPDGKFTKSDKTVAPAPGAKAIVRPSPVTAKDATKAPQVAAATTTTQAPTAGVQSEVKPPQSWKPLAREHWAKLPPEVQAEVSRREKEIATALSDSAPAKKFQDEFQQMLTPYRPMLGNAEPKAVIGNLLQSAYVLNHAPPQQKAELMARMVKQFGVDIEALDAALAGEPSKPKPHQGPQAIDPGQIAAQVRQQLQQEWAAQRAKEQAQAFQSESPEFLEDLRPEISGLLQAGLAKDLKSAYNWALSRHRGDPDSEIGKVLRQREEAKQASANNAPTQRAVLAGSSVKSQPAPRVAGSGPSDTRAAVEAAWEKLSRR
jgi:hypothetical protein